MNLFEFYDRLVELNTTINNQKELLIAFQEQFYKINSVWIDNKSNVLAIYVADIENKTDYKTITYLQDEILYQEKLHNINYREKISVKIVKDDNIYDVKDIAEDIENTITIGLIEF